MNDPRPRNVLYKKAKRLAKSSNTTTLFQYPHGLKTQWLKEVKDLDRLKNYRAGVVENFSQGRRRQRFNLKINKDSPSTLKKFFKVLEGFRNRLANSDEFSYATLRFVNNFGQFEFREIFIDNFNTFMNQINQIKQNNTISGSDTVGENFEIDMAFFIIRFAVMAGGTDNYSNKKIKSKYFKLKNPKSFGNNCLLSCCKFSTGNKDNVKLIRSKLLNFGIPKKAMISLDKIHHIEDYFETRIDVYEEPSKLVYQSSKHYENKLNVLLKDQHYSIITKLNKEKQNNNLKELLLFFDLETVFNKDNNYFLKPYSVSWFKWDPEKDFNYNKIHFDQCEYHTENPLEKLHEFILNCPEGYKYKIIGFNNSKFDNFFMAQHACIQGDLSYLFYVNNSILKMAIGKHSTFDTCRFLITTLDKACESFHTNPKKIKGFNHNIPQSQYENKTLDKWLIDNHEKIEEYNKLDVLSLCDLTMKLIKVVKYLTNENILKYMTIGEFAYDFYKKHSKYRTPKPKCYKDDLFIRSSLTAGRTQCFYGRSKLIGDLRMPDVTSLYPHIMNSEYFPYGDYINTDKYIKGKLGIYNCIIKNQNMKWINEDKIIFPEGFKTKYAPVVVPRRDEDVEISLDWNYRGEMKCQLSSVDIDLIIKNGGEVQIFSGLYWEHSTNELFKNYITPFMNEKIKQDKFKQNGDNQYNGALREFCKLCLNSLSGKVIQRNFTKIFQRIENDKDMEKFESKTKHETRKEYYYSKNLVFAEGELKDENDIFRDKAKPSYLGIFIYAYARRYMYEKLLSRYFVMYMDTDSTCTTKIEYDRMVRENKELFNGKKFGNLEEEVGEAKMIITISPKNYLVYNPTDESKCKRKFKGVNINYKNGDTWAEIKIHSGKQDSIVMNNKTIKTLDEISIKDVIELRKTEKKCGSNEMFETLYNQKSIVIFSSHLRKHKSFECDGVFKIEQKYIYKVINVEDFKKELNVKDKMRYILDKTIIKDKGNSYEINYKDLRGKRIFFRRSYIKNKNKDKIYKLMNKTRDNIIYDFYKNEKNIIIS